MHEYVYVFTCVRVDTSRNRQSEAIFRTRRFIGSPGPAPYLLPSLGVNICLCVREEGEVSRPLVVWAVAALSFESWGICVGGEKRGWGEFGAVVHHFPQMLSSLGVCLCLCLCLCLCIWICPCPCLCPCPCPCPCRDLCLYLWIFFCLSLSLSDYMRLCAHIHLYVCYIQVSWCLRVCLCVSLSLC